MGFQIGIAPEEVFLNEDRRWLGARLGADVCRSITLDPTLFDDVHIAEKGALPSGLVLAQVTATGRYGPYGGAADESQTITVDATGGTYTLTFDGQTTGAIAENAAAGAVQSALEALTNIAVGDVIVTGADGGPYTVTFGGALAGTDVAQMTGDGTNLTGGAGTVTIVTSDAGSGEGAGGLGVAAGHLFSTTPIDKVNNFLQGAALFWHGIVKTAFLPTFPVGAGELNDAARADLSAHIRYED